MNKTGLLLALLLLAGAGYAVFGLTQPNEMAGHSMTPPDTSELAEGAPIVEVALPDGLSQDARIGQRGFEAKCASCHGRNAAGRNGVAPPLVHEIYEPGHHSDHAFVLATQNGVRSHHWRFGNMPPIEGVTPADAGYIATYVRELQEANGIY
ncbi:cytochrome c (plasmid) [Roseivivax marinus]|uniref:c-type cytochrome n=1 Tax=Roseivivax marinus TaxID=1379903 RepID=UPI001F04CCBD|nr:c-type cytochrome [Roseivivax marinus]UMA67390.1 cytochrome c [Roseivivax marinus]